MGNISLEAEILRLTKGPMRAFSYSSRILCTKLVALWRVDRARSRLYFEAGNLQSRNRLVTASLLDVHDVEALNLIATMSMRQNHLEDAFRAQRRAVARQPDEPRQYVMLSNILEKMGRRDEADSDGESSLMQSIAQTPALAN